MIILCIHLILFTFAISLNCDVLNNEFPVLSDILFSSDTNLLAWDFLLIPDPCCDRWKSRNPYSSLYVSYILKVGDDSVVKMMW